MAINFKSNIVDGDKKVIFVNKNKQQNLVLVSNKDSKEVYRANVPFEIDIEPLNPGPGIVVPILTESVGDFLLAHYKKDSNGNMQEITETITLTDDGFSSHEPYTKIITFKPDGIPKVPIKIDGVVYPRIESTKVGNLTYYYLPNSSNMDYSITLACNKHQAVNETVDSTSNINKITYAVAQNAQLLRNKFIKVTSGNVYEGFDCAIEVKAGSSDTSTNIWANHSYTARFETDDVSYTKISDFYLPAGSTIRIYNCEVNDDYAVYVDGTLVTGNSFEYTITNLTESKAQNILSSHITYKNKYSFRINANSSDGHASATSIRNTTTGQTLSAGTTYYFAQGDVITWTSTADTGYAFNSSGTTTKSESYTVTGNSTKYPASPTHFRFILQARNYSYISTSSYVKLYTNSARTTLYATYNVSSSSQTKWLPKDIYYPVTYMVCTSGYQGYRYCYSYSLGTTYNSKYTTNPTANQGSVTTSKTTNYLYTSSSPNSASYRKNSFSLPTSAYIPRPPYAVAARAILRVSGGTYHDWFSWGEKKATGYASGTSYGVQYYANSRINTHDLYLRYQTSTYNDANVSALWSSNNLGYLSGNNYVTGTSNGYAFPSVYHWFLTSGGSGGCGDILISGNITIKVPRNDCSWSENKENQYISDTVTQSYGGSTGYGAFPGDYCGTYYIYSTVSSTSSNGGTSSGSLYYLLGNTYDAGGPANYGTSYYVLMQPTSRYSWTDLYTVYSNAYI